MKNGFETVVTGLCFPEGPRWHEEALWFSDIYAQAVLRLESDGTCTLVAEVPELPSGIGFLPDGRLLVVSMHDRRVLRLEQDGLQLHADLSALATWHCNDMVVDSCGRAYVGNFGSSPGPSTPPTPTVLIMVSPTGEARVVAQDLVFPNGMAVTSDGANLIVAESFSVPPRLTAFSIAQDGTLHDRRVVVEFADHEVPDGIDLDDKGGIWVALPLADAVVRIDSSGTIDQRLPIKGPLAIAVGGLDGRALYVCTAPVEREAEAATLRGGAIQRARIDV